MRALFAAASLQTMALAALATPALAQEGTSVDRARALFSDGVRALDAGSYSLAAARFRTSYELAPRAATMCNLALTYDRWAGHEGDAAAAYDECARIDTSGRYRQGALDRAQALRAAASRQPTPAPTPTTEAQRQPEEAPIVRIADVDPGGDAAASAAASPNVSAWDGAVAPPPSTSPDDRDDGGRSHGLLYAGVVSAVLAAASLVAGVLLVQSANRDDARLRERYPDGMIPAGSPDADVLDDAQTRSTFGIALYVIAGALAALGTTLVIVDLGAGGSGPSGSDAAHASLSLRGRF